MEAPRSTGGSCFLRARYDVPLYMYMYLIYMFMYMYRGTSPIKTGAHRVTAPAWHTHPPRAFFTSRAGAPRVINPEPFLIRHSTQRFLESKKRKRPSKELSNQSRRHTVKSQVPPAKTQSDYAISG